MISGILSRIKTPKGEGVEILSANIPLRREVRDALEFAADDMSMKKREIIAEAIEDWLDALGYLDEYLEDEEQWKF